MTADADKAVLSLRPQALLHLAAQPGSGWGASIKDMQEVLQPHTFSSGSGGQEGSAGEAITLSWPAFYRAVMCKLNY